MTDYHTAHKIAQEIFSKRRQGEGVLEASLIESQPIEIQEAVRDQIARLQKFETAGMQSEKPINLPPNTAGADFEEEPITEEVVGPKFSRFTIQELPDDSHFRATLQLPGRVVPSNFPDSFDASLAPLSDRLSRVPLKVPLDPHAGTSVYRPSNRPPMAFLQLIHDGQITSSLHPIMKDRFRIGRVEGDIIVPFDLWISAKHAEIQRYRRGTSFYWIIKDLKSTNGTFLHTKKAELLHGDEIFLGRERYRFLIEESKPVIAHATKGSGQMWSPNSTRIVLGRSAHSELKPLRDDPYLDPIHAEIHQNEEGKWILYDKNSLNGTWCRIDEEELLPQCMFQVGEQRFRFYAGNPDDALPLL